jgi:hypothetical protein
VTWAGSAGLRSPLSLSRSTRRSTRVLPYYGWSRSRPQRSIPH